MTLASQMSSGELRDWFRDRLADQDGAREMLEAIQAALPGRSAAVVGSPGRSAQDSALVDLAITQRVAFAVEPAPPYYALLGAHLSDLVDVARAHVAAGSFPTHTPLPMVVRIRRLDRRPTPAGWIDAASPQPWKSYHDELFGSMTLASDPPSAWDQNPEHQGRAPSEVLGLCHWISSALRHHARPGHLAAPNHDAPTNHAAAATETSLAAACLALASWEHAYRQRCPLPTDPIWNAVDARDGVEAMQTVLAAAEPDLVAEVEAMTALAADSGALTRLRALAGDGSTRVPLGRRGPVPLGYARPVLVPHWADATAVVGDAGTPGGTTLLTLHTSTDPPDPAQALAWCHELLALAWLDAHHLYRIGHVALYLARHGTLVTWPVTELATLLAGLSPDDHDRLNALRDEFRSIACRAITVDGADPRWAQPPPAPHLAATTGTDLVFAVMRNH